MGANMAKPTFVVKLQRGESTDQGTLGRLLLPTGHSWFSLELPWRDNTPRLSSIPAGSYLCIWGRSPRVGYRYEIMGVPNRSAVLIHSCNRAGDINKGFKTDLLGCIGLGKVRGRLEGQLAIFQSRIAMQEFHAIMQGRPFTLEITNANSSI